MLQCECSMVLMMAVFDVVYDRNIQTFHCFSWRSRAFWFLIVLSQCVADRANSVVSDYMVSLSDYVKTIKYSMRLDPGTLRGLVASASR